MGPVSPNPSIIFVGPSGIVPMLLGRSPIHSILGQSLILR